jgi:HTH-type transcriptional regulator, sugar sensing transcriptional regulator
MYNDNEHLRRLLQELGISETAATIYEAMLDLEAVSIRIIATKSGVNRGTTYEALKSLRSLHLVSTKHKGKREHFVAESPEKIFDLIRDRRKELLRISIEAQKLVPNLLARSVRPEGRPLVRYYEEDAGIVTILKDIIHTCHSLPDKTYYVYSSGSVRKYLYRKFPSFTDKRVAEGISVKAIALGPGGDPSPLSERRWLPDAQNDEHSSYIIIYGDKIAHIAVSGDYTPYGVVIEDSNVASMHRVMFHNTWQSLDKDR